MRLRMLLTILLLAGLATAAENIYPDPGFEAGGRPGVAHSGQRAGYLSVGARQHFVYLGERLKVEPYATYRATAWVRAKCAVGAAQALYVYAWDSYVWAFGAQANIPAGDDWKQVSITFRVPFDHLYFHPLALTDAANAEAWVDDIVVERIASAAETILQLRKLTKLGADDARLLARWELAQGEPFAAEKVMGLTDDRVARADIACLLGLAAKSTSERARHLVAMLVNGAAELNDGAKRLGEVGAGVPLPVLMERLKLVAPTARPTVVRGLPVALKQMLPRDDTSGSLAARRAAVEQAAATVADAQRSLPEASTALAPVLAELTARRRRLEAEMKQLGRAQVVIDGAPVTPRTYAIVVPDHPTPSEDRAARDLQAHLERITGQALPVVKAVERGDRACFVVGRSPLAGLLGVKVDYERLGAEGVRIATAGRHVVLTGNQRGVLYAVYVFLEEHLGCRWFTPDCATWPTEGTITVGPLDRTEVPALEYRATDYPNSRPPEFAVRNRLNGAQVEADASWGGHITYRGFVHTFNALVSPDEWYASHPEYFSEVGGKRLRDYTQLCLTNPEVLKIAIASVRRWIKESPEANIISVSQNDWHNYCECANCRRVAEAEGSQSGPLLHFVNAIADDIAKDHPHVIIDTLAYQYTRQPPKVVRPRPNVAIRLCSIECEFNRPLATSPYNQTFVADIKGWQAICKRLHIWDYVINYAHTIMPFPNLRVLQPNIQFFIANGVTGIYEEADYYTKGGELAELRTYLMAKLLWHPKADVERATREFLAAYYGPAAKPIAAYLEQVHKLAVSDANYHMPIYVGPTGPHLSDAALSSYEKLFDQAEAAVKDDAVRLHRVQVARLPIVYTRIAKATRPGYKLTDQALVPVTGGDVGPRVAWFEKVARAEGVRMISEGQSFDAWLSRVDRGPREVPLVKLAAGDLVALVAPGLGGRVLSLRLGQRELLQLVRHGDEVEPTTGGYKEFSESGYQSPGWNEPYEVVERSATAVKLRSRPLANGLVFERRYELSGGCPELLVSSRLTNPSGGDKQARIRVHACFHLSQAKGAALDLGGLRRSLAPGATKETELWLREKDRPAGEWSIIDRAGKIRITNRFQPEQVEVCYFNWHGPDHRANPELWSPQRTLKAGESLVLDHRYQFTRP